MKQTILVLLIALHTSLALASNVLPPVQAPAELRGGEFAEGTLTRLSATDVAEFLPWAQNAQSQLNRALTVIKQLPLRERLPRLQQTIKNVVTHSGSRQYQALMRFALNRGLVLATELEAHSNPQDIGITENILDLLQRSITVALAFYESDLAFQQRVQRPQDGATVIPHARFGASFMRELFPAVVNVLDANAQFRLLSKLVEMVNWDLSRDAEANRFAEIIVEAYEMGQDLPTASSNDDRSTLRQIRKLNSLRIINLRPTATLAELAVPIPVTAPQVAVAEVRSMDLPTCVNTLSSSTSLSGSGAASYCQQNRSVMFVNCVTNLSRTTSLSGSGAASYCLQDNSEQFVKCTSTLGSRTSLSGSGAASYCRQRKSDDFIACTTTLGTRTSLSGSGAASYCLQNHTAKFVDCTVAMANSMSGSGAASTCLRQ